MPLRETNQLFLNRGGGRFEDVSADSGEEFARLEVSRGAAIGDVDNDGDDDILLVNNNDPARLLINQLGQHQHWIGLRVVEDDDGPAAIGARVEVLRPDGAPLVRRVRRNVSYCSASDPRVRVGLGDRDEVQVVRVAWPGGEIEQWTDLPIDRYTTLVRGSGQPVSP